MFLVNLMKMEAVQFRFPNWERLFRELVKTRTKQILLKFLPKQTKMATEQ